MSRTFLVAATCTLCLMAGANAVAQPADACVQAGRRAAEGAELPPGLLPAVARVESGRWDPLQQRVASWPWAIDVAGQPRFFADKSAAVAATRKLIDAGHRNIDVGCYQISLLHHPYAFASLDQAFDPAANARYAARFLTSLHQRYGNWSDAVAAYHSADPALGIPYRNLVYAAWHPVAADAPVLPPEQSDPSVHVWTPRAVGTAPAVILIPGEKPVNAMPLPRVITPGQ